MQRLAGHVVSIGTAQERGYVGNVLRKDANRVLAVKGSNAFSNNIINGSYKLLSNG